MVDAIKAVFREVAAIKAQTRALQSQMVSLQDILEVSTRKCFDNQIWDAKWRPCLDVAVPLCSSMYSLYTGRPDDNKLLSAIATTFSRLVFDPRQLDHQRVAQMLQKLETQTNRLISGLDQMRQTHDSAEQNLRHSRQAGYGS